MQKRTRYVPNKPPESEEERKAREELEVLKEERSS